jgi:hypothetical protein
MQIAPLLDGAMEKLGQKDHDASCCGFLKTKPRKEVGAALGASEDAAQNAREPRAGKAAEIFHQTRREFDHGHHCRNDFRQFRSSRAGGAGKIRDRRGDCQRRGGFSGSTLTLIKGALKIMAWTKAKTFKRKPFYTPPARCIMSHCEFAKASARRLRHERRS